MSKHWLEANEARLTAEILRDFCFVSITLDEQFVRFDHAGNVSYAVLREILGDQMNKGLLWRLKDTAHHLLRDAPGNRAAGPLLDWAIGYLFHETWKLMEGTHQNQYYAPGVTALVEGDPSREMEAVAGDFTRMAMENRTEMGRAMNRIRQLLVHARLFFHRCYAGKTDNLYLARFLHDRADLVGKAFPEESGSLAASIYGDAPHLLFLHAASSLRHGGKTEAARAALEKAKALAPDDPRVVAALNETG